VTISPEDRLGAAGERTADPFDDDRRPVFGDHPDNDPAQSLQHLGAVDVLHILTPIGAMLVAVVFDGDHRVLPTHVQVSYRSAEPHLDLSHRRGQARVDENQP
jgi:hypothetical protein